MSKGHRSVLQGFTWLVSGRLASALVSVISTAVLARLLTPTDFGLVAAAFVVLALANVIFDGAFGINIVRKKELRPEDVSTTLTVALLLGFLLAGITIIASPAIERFFGFPQLATILQITSVTIPLKAMASISCSQLQRAGRFKQLSLAAVVGQLVGYVLVASPMAYMGLSVWSLVAAIVVAGLVECVMAVWMARMPLRFGLDREALRDIGETSFFSAANMMNWAANTSANAVIGHRLDATGLGFYSRAWKLLDLFVAATGTPLSRALLPKFSSLQDRKDALQRAFLTTMSLVVPVYAVASVLFVLQAPLIVRLTLGEQWDATVHVAQILFAVLIPRCAFKVSEVFAAAAGKAKSAFARQGFYCLLMVAGSTIGVNYGILGVAIGVSVAVTIFYMTSMGFAMSIGGFHLLSILRLHLRGLLLAGFVSLADGAVLWAVGSTPMIVAHILAGAAGTLCAVLLSLALPRFFFGNDVAVMGESLVADTARRIPFLKNIRFRKFPA